MAVYFQQNMFQGVLTFANKQLITLRHPSVDGEEKGGSTPALQQLEKPSIIHIAPNYRSC